MNAQATLGMPNGAAMIDLIAAVSNAHRDLVALMDAIEIQADGEGRCDIIAAIARSAKGHLKASADALEGVREHRARGARPNA